MLFFLFTFSAISHQFSGVFLSLMKAASFPLILPLDSRGLDFMFLTPGAK